MSAGHSSSTCLGVSASSLHTVHQPARHDFSLHCGQSGPRLRPIRCIYCAEPDQCPARS